MYKNVKKTLWSVFFFISILICLICVALEILGLFLDEKWKNQSLTHFNGKTV